MYNNGKVSPRVKNPWAQQQSAETTSSDELFLWDRFVRFSVRVKYFKS